LIAASLSIASPGSNPVASAKLRNPPLSALYARNKRLIPVQPLCHIGLRQALFLGGKMDELTLLAVGEAIKAEAGGSQR
jgi:hypothetical protein